MAFMGGETLALTAVVVVATASASWLLDPHRLACPDMLLVGPPRAVNCSVRTTVWRVFANRSSRSGSRYLDPPVSVDYALDCRTFTSASRVRARPAVPCAAGAGARCRRGKETLKARTIAAMVPVLIPALVCLSTTSCRGRYDRPARSTF